MHRERKSLGHAGGTLAGIAAISLVMAACSSVSNLIGTSSADAPPASTATGAATDPTTGTGVAELKPEDYACPDVTVRPGAGTLLIGGQASAGEGGAGAMELRYQGTLVRFARDCTPRAGTMTMKVGIEGRVVTGPAGIPGNIDVPLRIAVVQEGPEPKTVVSKLVHIPVTIAPDTSSAAFTHVDPDIAFPVPKPVSNLDSYVVYVGFDPSASAPQKPKSKPKPKR